VPDPEAPLAVPPSPEDLQGFWQGFEISSPVKGRTPAVQQDYAHHTRIDPHFHYVALPLAALTFLAALIRMLVHFSLGALLLAATALAVCLALARLRRYATGLQDRIIRVEENFRHHVLTGSPLDPRLTLAQIIALRFAGDGEFPALARRAAEEGLKPDEIKRAVREWRPDNHRV
jgi:hypothetical protein